MARVVLRYVNTFRSRGKLFAYYRRGTYRLRLYGEVGSPEFAEHYAEVHRRHEENDRRHAPGRVEPGSFADLVQRYQSSPEWTQLKAATHDDYQKAITPLVVAIGHVMVAEISRADVNEIRTLRATRDTPAGPVPSPRRANKTISVLSVLLSHAVDLGMRTDNPALRPRRLRTGDGYRPWTDDELGAFVARVPEMRLAVLLAVATGQRSGDLIRMTWRAYDGQAIEVVQQKTGSTVWVPCHPDLKAALDAVETRQAVTILTRPDGQTWEKSTFQTTASKAIRTSGLSGIVWHGLRHTAASWLAEAGCSDREIMAITGHRSSAMVGRYVAKADQRKRAEGAITKLSTRRLER